MSTLVPPALGDTPLSAALHIPRDRQIGSLLRRFFAFSLDSIIIGIIPNLFVWPFLSTLSHLGSWAPLLGFFLALPYFALMNSRVGNGQTLGKRLLSLQVVHRDGNTLSVADATLRYAVFSIAYYLGNVALPLTKTPGVIVNLIQIITLSLSVSIIYLLLFNRRTRQGLHDLAVDSFVADATQSGPLNPQPIWKTHWVILGGILAVSLVLGGILENNVRNLESFPELRADVDLVEEMPGVYAASARERHAGTPGNRMKSLVIAASWTGNPDDAELFADDVARTIFERDAQTDQWDTVRIVVTSGFNIGIGSYQTSKVFERTPAAWRERLRQ